MVFLPKKIYLNGSDCFHLILERNHKLSGEGNNQLYLCVQLTSEDALTKIKANVTQSPLLDWIANIKLVNPQIGVPFYKYVYQGRKINIQHHGIVSEQFPSELLNNRLAIKKNQFFRIDSYQFEAKYYLLLTFHHVLFDGKGAGLLLQHLTKSHPDSYRDDMTITKETITSFFPRRLKWKSPVKQWLNLIYVKKTVEKTNEGKTAYLSEQYPEQSGFGLFSHTFSEEETDQIKENAKANGVRFGLNFFQIACCAKAFRTVFTTINDLWIPIPYNGRKRGSAGTIISNYISFIFHRLTVKEKTSLKEITGQLQQQMNEQLKDQLPEKYNRLLQLMRFFPTWFNHSVTTKSSKGNIASFLYSSTELGESENTDLISKQWTLPPFSYPPGLTINFYTYQNQLNFHIAYSKKVLNSEQVSIFPKELIEQLLR